MTETELKAIEAKIHANRQCVILGATANFTAESVTIEEYHRTRELPLRPEDALTLALVAEVRRLGAKVSEYGAKLGEAYAIARGEQ